MIEVLNDRSSKAKYMILSSFLDIEDNENLTFAWNEVQSINIQYSHGALGQQVPPNKLS